MIAKLARWCRTWRWLVVVGWLLAAASVFLVGEGDYRLDFDTPGESNTAARLIEERFSQHTFPTPSMWFGSERQLKMFGFGFAIPILLDVLLIRLVLVPALMELIRRAN